MSETPEARAARRAGRTGRAAQRGAFVANRQGDFNRVVLDMAMAQLLAAAPGLAGLVTGGFPTSNLRRWVPIGPSVIRSSATADWHRATGRVRDIAVSDDGKRAYAASGKGGVWYTDDAGAMWAPVGGWANRAARRGGPNNAQSCGCLLVKFGATAAQDFVMVGTGEGVMMFNRTPARPSLGGLGVLAALDPAATAGAGGDPWEGESGRTLMEGLSIFALARHPDSVAGDTGGAGQDEVLAATDAGLFRGVRQPTNGGEFRWTELTGLSTFLGLVAPARAKVTDVMWLRHPAQSRGRIVVAVCNAFETPTVRAAVGAGVAYSDDGGASFHWVTGLNMTVLSPPAVGRMSFASPAGSRVYILGDQRRPAGTDNDATVWRVDDMTAATPTANRLTGVPIDLFWQGGPSQRDYDQAIAVEQVSAAPIRDRIYLGGSFKITANGMAGAVYCFDVTPALALVPSADISRVGAPPGGDGATLAGLVGDNVHADIQGIKVVGPPGNRQVWVACDGGVYVSGQAGRVSTYIPRATGFAAIEANFLASHPSSSHYMAIGTQDNGRHLRIGDVLWEDTQGGDGGGVMFHPNRSQFVISQTTRDGWHCDPAAGFVHPLRRGLGFGAPRREGDLSAFYSGAASVRRNAAVGRMVVGTNRVWLTDDLGSGAANTWHALPYPSGPVGDPRAGGLDAPADRDFGLPSGGPLPGPGGGVTLLGVIITQKWASATELLVMYERGIVRWTQNPVNNQWSTRLLLAPAGIVLAAAVVGAPDPAVLLPSDIAPLPGTQNFYLTTTGNLTTGDTCYFFNNATSTYSPADLRNQLPQVAPLPQRPLDPAYAVTVDPVDPSNVYVGTVTGVWHGVRTAGVAAHTWTPMPNGLPQAAVQDLNIWVDPDDNSRRLLRAAIQARGVWEVDLTAASEPQRTYLRVHAQDDRRRLPTPLANPRRQPGVIVPAFASPDIVVRPRANPASWPRWQLGAAVITAGTSATYQLWTFQTAFRWHFPSVIANGVWDEAFADLVQLHRHRLGLPVRPDIDQTLWERVVRDTHLNAAGAVTAAAGDPLAVYRAPWQTPAALTGLATEVDIVESVVPPSIVGSVHRLFSEPSTVDVLLHHRDTRPINASGAFVILLWRHAASPVGVLTPTTISGIPAYITSVLTAEGILPPNAVGALPAVPAGWTLATNPAGRALHRLGVRLDARMPRAVSIDVDLSGVGNGRRVLFLAVAGSTVDPCAAAPVGLPAAPSMSDLVCRWPYAAMRMIQVSPRP